MPGVVIPTRFERDSLQPLIESASQVAQVVVVHTEPGHPDVPKAVNVHDYRRNIQHWWNTGLDECAGSALVLNDDIGVSPEALRDLLTALEQVDLVYVPGRSKRSPTPISGWCFGLHPERLRPDPEFVWWCGDDDLWQRATSRRLVEVEVTHLVRKSYKPTEPVLLEAIEHDQALYRERWASAS